MHMFRLPTIYQLNGGETTFLAATSSLRSDSVSPSNMLYKLEGKSKYVKLGQVG